MLGDFVCLLCHLLVFFVCVIITEKHIENGNRTTVLVFQYNWFPLDEF